MSLYEDHHHRHHHNEFHNEDFVDEKELSYKKKVRRLLEDKLERKRLREECEDGFNDSEDTFDWLKLD